MTKPWAAPTERLSKEFEAVGFFLTGHPSRRLQGGAWRPRRRDLGRVCHQGENRRVRGTLAGTVLSASERKGKTGNPYRLRRLLRSRRASSRLWCSPRRFGGLAALARAGDRRAVSRWRPRPTARPCGSGCSAFLPRHGRRSSHAGMRVYVEDPRGPGTARRAVGAKGGEGQFRLVLCASRNSPREVEIRAAARDRLHAAASGAQVEAGRGRRLDQRALGLRYWALFALPALPRGGPTPITRSISHAGR